MRRGYCLRADPQGTNLVLHLLLAAYPSAVDLCAALHTADHDAVKDRVRYLRRHGHRIRGLAKGYVYEIAPERSRRAAIVKA